MEWLKLWNELTWNGKIAPKYLEKTSHLKIDKQKTIDWTHFD